MRATRDAPSAAAMAGAARTLRRRLQRDGVLRRAEGEELLGRQRAHGVGLWRDVVRAPPSGTWERRRADLLALAESWIDPPALTVRAATELLVRRYLAGFGPASAKDVASFTGLRLTALEPALSALELLPEEHRPKLFSTKTPRSFPTFLLDGAVAGRWRHERGRIELEPFGRLDAAARRALREEAERLASFHA